MMFRHQIHGPARRVGPTPTLGNASTSVGVTGLANLQLIFGVTIVLAMILCMALLFHSWNHYLIPGAGSAVFGYDPYRFFFYAKNLAAGGVDLARLREISLNYNGAVLYYATIFYLFGVTSWLPPLINLGVFGLVIRGLIRDLSANAQSAKILACIPLILLYPDLLWFGVMTGKELPSVILVTLIGSMAFRYLNGGIGLSTAVMTAVALFLLVGLRPSLVVIPIATFLLHLAVSPHGSRTKVVVYLLLAIGSLFAAPVINEVLGSARFDALSLFAGSLNRFEALQQQGLLSFGNDSISRMLYSRDPVMIVLTMPIKILWYLIAPLQNPNFSWSGLLSGKWADAQGFCTTVSALINIVLLPYVLHTLMSLRDPRRSAAWRESAVFFTLLFVSSVAIVVLSGIEFHLRFRVLFIVPFILLAGLSFGSNSAKLAKLKWLSYAGVVAAFLLYAALKL